MEFESGRCSRLRRFAQRSRYRWKRLRFAFDFVASDSQRRRGGIGRRAGLKIQWPQGRVGSSPSAGTGPIFAAWRIHLEKNGSTPLRRDHQLCFADTDFAPFAV
jgi:hypothetical protein